MPGRDLGKLSFLFLNLNLWGIWGTPTPDPKKKNKNTKHLFGITPTLVVNSRTAMKFAQNVYMVYLPTMKGWFLWEQKTNDLGGGFNPSETY